MSPIVSRVTVILVQCDHRGRDVTSATGGTLNDPALEGGAENVGEPSGLRTTLGPLRTMGRIAGYSPGVFGSYY